MVLQTTTLGATGIDSGLEVCVSMPGVEGTSRKSMPFKQYLASTTTPWLLNPRD